MCALPGPLIMARLVSPVCILVLVAITVHLLP
jgi:hypothetical protein